MHSEKINVNDTSSANLIRRGDMDESINVTGRYTAECIGADGAVKWVDEFENTVVTEGKAKLFNVSFASDTQVTQWFLGLVNNTPSPTFTNVADTMASHSWTESVDYSNATRPQGTFTTTATNSISTSATSFSMNASVTIAGAFLTTNNTKGGTTGTLYSAGAFSGGNRTVVSGDTINVTYTTSA